MATTRRDFIKIGAGGILGAMLARGFGRALAAPAPRTRACVVLWLNGGPSHTDTFDPKAHSKFKKIATRAPAIELSEHLPRLGEQAHRLAIVRSMTSREGNHERAQSLLHTGYVPNPTIAYPSLGAWTAEELAGGAGDLPPFVAINGPSAGAGFLGVQHGPFIVPNPTQPPLNTTYPKNVDFERFARRKAALESMEARFATETGDPKVGARRETYDKAVRMMYSSRLRAFDLAEEAQSVRAAYGNNNFGAGCLMARRLVEAGVRYVEVVLDGWDTHKNNFDRTRELSGVLDPAFATLLDELAARDLLDRTLVVCMGEFGRTPKINENDGRDHYPQAWSAMLAGGGVRGGIVHGATDADGAKVVDKPVGIPDFFATLATLLGLDPQKELRTPVGRPIAITDGGTPIRELMM
jgi:uncharacterized protein (DUF1501 family)